MENPELQGVAGVEIDSSQAIIRVQSEIYGREAVLRSAYWLLDRAYILISRHDRDLFEVRIRPKQPKPSLQHPNPPSIDELAGEFCNELLENQLRREISVETQTVRELILAKAFAEAGVLEDPPTGEFGDPIDQRNSQGLVQITSETD